MSVAKRQAKSASYTAGGGQSTLSLTLDSAVLAGSTLVAAIHMLNGGVTVTGVTDNVNAGSYTLDKGDNGNVNTGWYAQIYSKSNVSAGSTTITLTCTGDVGMSLTVYELTSVDTGSPTDGTTSDHTANTTTPSGSITPSQANDCIIATCAAYSTPSDIAVGGSFTRQQFAVVNGSAGVCDAYWLDVGDTSAKTVSFTITGAVAGPYPTMVAVAYKLAATGGLTPTVGSGVVTGQAGLMDRGVLTSTTLKGQT